MAASAQNREPLVADGKASAAERWLNKAVLERRSLDDMEDLTHWSSYTTSGGAVVDARKVMKTLDSSASVATIQLSAVQVHHGTYSLLMRTPTRLPGPGPVTGRGWGRSGIRRSFEGEDWTGYNRISFWVYPDLPGFYTTALDLRLYNDGREKLPALFGQEGETSLVLRNHEWNHVVWEIGNVARDKITAFEASYGLSGSAPGEADSINFYFDELSLERVIPDKTEGWDVWGGRIAFSQAGYSIGASKTAIASGLEATRFQLLDTRSGNLVLDGPVTIRQTSLGTFQVMDFTRVRTPGQYSLRVGAVSTPAFSIGDDVWKATIWKVLNFLYTERCGYEVPGVHGVCHRDWTCVHGDKRIVINGGWHDAGDLSQQAEATCELTYALFSLAEKYRGDDSALYTRVLEEARWGLDWILKTRFGDGFRDVGSINSRRTDGILGNDDDITVTARNNPVTNFEAAGVEALAYQTLEDTDPLLANYALQAARADWAFACQGMPGIVKPAGIFRGSFDPDAVEDEIPSVAILSSIELYRATEDTTYSVLATRLAHIITDVQQRVSLKGWDVPFVGFFYTDASHDRFLHYCHRGRDQEPSLALAALCRTFPDNPDFMKWYTCLTLYGEYMVEAARYTEPFGVLPGGIYSDTEYLHVPESRMESYRQQVLKGIPLGRGHYLRLFPVWMDYRGHFGVILPQAQALAASGRLRNDPVSTDLAERQLEWILGRNPFAASTMYGVGNDFVPLYSPSSGDMVGALPVGIQTRGIEDKPYWPVQSTWTYKEVWGHPVTNWIWLLSAIEGPARVSGRADSIVIFRDTVSDRNWAVAPDARGSFRLELPPGTYSIDGALHTFLPGASYDLNLRRDSVLSWTVKHTVSGLQVLIRVTARGAGRHRIKILADGLNFSVTEKDVLLKPGIASVLEFRGNTLSSIIPWVALVTVDGDNLHGTEVK